MEHREGTFPGAGELALYWQCWLPAGEPKAVLAIVHGVGEHSGRYAHVVEGATAAGYAVYGFDHRGHGRSPGQRGHVRRWDDYRGDVRAFLAHVAAEQPGAPVFLFGHSLGALIVLDYVLRFSGETCGTIVSGAPIEPVGVAKAHLILIARLLSRVLPRVSVPLGLEHAALSRDPAVVKAYGEDPLVQGKVSVRWGTESLATVAWVKAHPELVRQPILFIHGGADRLNSAAGVRRYYERIPFADKDLKVYEGSFHEVHNDLDHAQAVQDLCAWLDRHLPAPAGRASAG